MFNRDAAIENSIITNRSGPLRAVTGCEETEYHGFFEILECGHRGRLMHRVQNVVPGKRRRCAACSQPEK